MPRGVESKIPLRDTLEAHRAHQAGWSLRALARLHHEQWGYKTPASALEGLRAVFRTLDLPVRDRIEATVDASTRHGNLARAFKDPAHPEHARHLAQRRHNRRLKRELAHSVASSEEEA